LGRVEERRVGRKGLVLSGNTISKFFFSRLNYRHSRRRTTRSRRTRNKRRRRRRKIAFLEWGVEEGRNRCQRDGEEWALSAAETVSDA